MLRPAHYKNKTLTTLTFFIQSDAFHLSQIFKNLILIPIFLIITKSNLNNLNSRFELTEHLHKDEALCNNILQIDIGKSF